MQKIFLLFVLLIALPVNAQSFPNTQITPENADEVTLMATYTHTAPPVIAWSPDGRFLAIGRSIPEDGGPGGGDDPTAYQRPAAQYASGVILVYDTWALTADPILLRRNGTWIKKMIFTDNRLLVLANFPDEDYPQLLEWRFQGNTFTGYEQLSITLEDSFTIDTDTNVIGYFINGGTYMYEEARDAAWRVGSEGTYPQGESDVAAAGGFFAYVGEDTITIRTKEDPPDIYAAIPITSTDLPAFQMTSTGLYFEEQDTIWHWSNASQAMDGYASKRVLETSLIDFAVNPDETVIATITDIAPLGRALLLWDVRQREESMPYVMRWNRPDLEKVYFSPDGTRLLTVAGSKIELWSVPQNLPTPAEARALSAYNIIAYCGDTIQQVATGVDIGLVWSWFATDEIGIREHLDAAVYTIKIDEETVYYWTFITQVIADPVNNNDPTVYFYTPLGDALGIGSHRVQYQVEWARVIRDGYTSYGPGTNNPVETGECTIEITG